jgi:hypothetical protein
MPAQVYTVCGVRKSHGGSPGGGFESTSAIAIQEKGRTKDVNECDGGERGTGSVGSYGQWFVTRHNSSSVSRRARPPGYIDLWASSWCGLLVFAFAVALRTERIPWAWSPLPGE